MSVKNHTKDEPAVEASRDTRLEQIDKEFKRLYNIKNPKTGQRYDIPLLDINQPGYYFKYIDYMKMFEQDPAAFERMLRWD